MKIDGFMKTASSAVLGLALFSNAGCERVDTKNNQGANVVSGGAHEKISSNVRKMIAPVVDVPKEKGDCYFNSVQLNWLLDELEENENQTNKDGQSPELKAEHTKIITAIKEGLECGFMVDSKTGKPIEYTIGVWDPGEGEGGCSHGGSDESWLHGLKTLRLLQLNNFFGAAHFDVLNKSAQFEIQQFLKALLYGKGKPTKIDLTVLAIKDSLLYHQFNLPQERARLKHLMDTLDMYRKKDYFEFDAAYTYAIPDCEANVDSIEWKDPSCYDHVGPYYECIDEKRVQGQKAILSKLAAVNKDPKLEKSIGASAADLSETIEVITDAYAAEKNGQAVTASTLFDQATKKLPKRIDAKH